MAVFSLLLLFLFVFALFSSSFRFLHHIFFFDSAVLLVLFFRLNHNFSHRFTCCLLVFAGDFVVHPRLNSVQLERNALILMMYWFDLSIYYDCFHNEELLLNASALTSVAASALLLHCTSSVG